MPPESKTRQTKQKKVNRMGNSSLVNYTKISPNKNSPRNKPITKITIHHMAGNLSVEACGNIFASPSRQASSNYGIGSDGRVGLYVDEKDRSWCSSSPENDHQAITIEVANSGGAPDWKVSDAALKKLIELCADICRRNGIKKLNFTGNKSGNLTMHKMFAATACPGPYLESKFPYIANEVNKMLNAQKGWVQASSAWYWYENGEPVKNQWVKDGGWWFHVGADGKMQTGFIEINGEVFYLNESRKNIAGKYIPQGACIITNDRGDIV